MLIIEISGIIILIGLTSVLIYDTWQIQRKINKLHEIQNELLKKKEIEMIEIKKEMDNIEEIKNDLANAIILK